MAQTMRAACILKFFWVVAKIVAVNVHTLSPRCTLPKAEIFSDLSLAEAVREKIPFEEDGPKRYIR